MPKPTTLASGQLNKSDQLDVELHRPATEPTFVLVRWPTAPSVASPDNFADLVAATFRVLAEARVTVKTHRCLGFGEAQNVLYTAQDRNRALLKWEDDQLPVLQASPLSRLFTVRRQRGQETIRWANGSRWGITAPNETAGHSQTLDLAFADEAWARTDNLLETGISPTMITRPQPQLWVVSTAGTVASTWLRGKVDAGRGQPDGRRTAYFEWSAARGRRPG